MMRKANAAANRETLGSRGGYVVVVRDRDGRARAERVDDAAAYRERLVSISGNENDSVSIDELATLLDQY
jgi:hypothetical protein